MKIKKAEAKDQITQRLRRIEGQIRGVENMVNEERDCHEIVQQLAAIRSAVQGASRFFLHEYATSCLLELGAKDGDSLSLEEIQKREKMVHDMIELLDKAP